MRSRKIGTLGPIFLLLAGLLTTCVSSESEGPQIQVKDVWARPAMAMGETHSTESSGGMATGQGMAGTGAVFMLLVNKGSEADRLVGARTDVAKVVEIHETRMEGEVMKMQMLPDGLEVPANEEVLLQPGSYHVMLIGMERDLEPGDSFSLELQFEKSGSLTVQPEVRQP